MPKNSKEIQGIATLDSKLFIALVESRQICSTSDFTEEDHVTVSDMKNPSSLVACSLYYSVYVCDYDGVGYIHRVELSNESVTKWTSKRMSLGLSKATAHNVIFTIYSD